MSAASTSNAGRWYLAGIGLALAAIGGLFCWLMARSYLRAHAMRSWPEVPCVILESGAEERRIDPSSPPEFRFRVEYGYEWQGKALTSEHWTLRENPWSSAEEKTQVLVRQYPAGSESTCRVDPQHPETAVLRMDSQAPGYSIWFPALFVVGGLGITARALTVGRKPRGASR